MPSIVPDIVEIAAPLVGKYSGRNIAMPDEGRTGEVIADLTFSQGPLGFQVRLWVFPDFDRARCFAGEVQDLVGARFGQTMQARFRRVDRESAPASATLPSLPTSKLPPLPEGFILDRPRGGI